MSLLLDRIEARLAELKASDKLSERKLLMNADLDLATIRRIRRGQIPGVKFLAKLESAMRLPPNFLTDAATERRAAPGDIGLQSVFVRGCVQAGLWQEAIEWDAADQFPITVPMDGRFPGLQRYGLLVRGNSMDRVYPEGTIVIVVQYSDLARAPRNGERVVVLRRDSAGDFEATLKEYELAADGRHILWPRSTAPEFQEPFVLGPEALPVADGARRPAGTVLAGYLHHVGLGDLEVTGLVVGSYRQEASR